MAAAQDELGPGDVALGLMRVDRASPAALTRAVAALTPDEAARAQRMRVEGARAQFASARALLRRMLTQRAGGAPADWRFRADARGRPVLEGDDPAFVFSLSHTDGLVACALARCGEIGVDVERLAPAGDLPALARHAFSGPEAEAIAALTGEAQAERFFACWTLREAYAKARGLGFLLDPTGFAFDLGPPDAIRFLAAGMDDPRRWRFLRAAPTADTRLALAVAAPLDLATLAPEWTELEACL